MSGRRSKRERREKRVALLLYDLEVDFVSAVDAKLDKMGCECDPFRRHGIGCSICRKQIGEILGDDLDVFNDRFKKISGMRV